MEINFFLWVMNGEVAIVARKNLFLEILIGDSSMINEAFFSAAAGGKMMDLSALTKVTFQQ